MTASLPAPQSRGRRDALILVVTLALVLAWDFTGFDIALTRHFGGPEGFPWREHWLTKTVLHDAVRVFGWVALAVVAVNVWRPWSWSRALSMSERLTWLLSTLACLLAVSWLKHHSQTSCPWSLAEFGAAGDAVYRSHWAFGQRDGGEGGCFPSGHASVGFALLPAWFALRARAPRAARLWLWGALLLGCVSGWTQLMRGAHHLSHSLWTAWICLLVATLAHHAARRWRPHGRAIAGA